MEKIKGIAVTAFFVLLLSSNFGMIVERLLVIFPSTQFSFLGANVTEGMADLEDETVAIEVNKMNVFYIGVENPITVAASSISSQDLDLKANDQKVTLRNTGKGQYIVNCRNPGNTTLTVQNRKTNKTKEFNFRIKRIPDPVVRLGKKTDGLMASGEFQAQAGLVAKIENFDFDAQCSIASYTLYYTRKRADPVEFQGTGGRFGGLILNAIKRAKPGDQYAFVNVKARCPGDVVGRRLNGLSFKIK